MTDIPQFEELIFIRKLAGYVAQYSLLDVDEVVRLHSDGLLTLTTMRHYCVRKYVQTNPNNVKKRTDLYNETGKIFDLAPRSIRDLCTQKK